MHRSDICSFYVRAFLMLISAHKDSAKGVKCGGRNSCEMFVKLNCNLPFASSYVIKMLVKLTSEGTRVTFGREGT